MNVAITRAKELLIVIGNGSVMQQDPYWKGFLHFAIRNKLFVIYQDALGTLQSGFFRRYVGPELDLEMDGNYISRLE